MASTKVYGVKLSEVMSRKNERTIPTLIKNIIRYLNTPQAIDTEALFRISAKPKELSVMKQKIDAGEEVNFQELKDPHLVANLLKTYLRELPEPLFSFPLYSQFIDAATEYETAMNLQRAKQGTGFGDSDTSHIDAYIETLSKLVDDLPAANKALAEILVLFLSRVGEHCDKNKMSPGDLAVAFGPLLLRPEVETIESMMNAAKITGIMKFMIEKFEKIFPKQKVRQRATKSAASTTEAQKSEESEKLERIKETVDDAIVLVQKKLNSLSHQLKETEQLDVAIDIARRVRTAKKVLFPGADEQKPVQKPVSTLSSNRKVLSTLRITSASAERQGKRKTMEDSCVLLDNLSAVFPEVFEESPVSAFYAVYDGHGGSHTSHICSELLHKNIIKSKKFSQETINEAIVDGYLSTDQYVLQQSDQEGFKDGSTAVTVLIWNNMLYVANAGDSEAVLCKVKEDGSVEGVVITERHSPTTPKEKQRIEKAGGAVFSGRVFGALAVSRSLGDGDFKIPTSEANFVSAEPYIDAIELTKDCSFLILACDGLFDKLTAQEAAEFVYAQINSGSLNEVANELADYALSKRTTDNVTTVLCKFDW